MTSNTAEKHCHAFYSSQLIPLPLVRHTCLPPHRTPPHLACHTPSCETLRTVHTHTPSPPAVDHHTCLPLPTTPCPMPHALLCVLPPPLLFPLPPPLSGWDRFRWIPPTLWLLWTDACSRQAGTFLGVLGMNCQVLPLFSPSPATISTRLMVILLPTTHIPTALPPYHPCLLPALPHTIPLPFTCHLPPTHPPQRRQDRDGTGRHAMPGLRRDDSGRHGIWH